MRAAGGTRALVRLQGAVRREGVRVMRVMRVMRVCRVGWEGGRRGTRGAGGARGCGLRGIVHCTCISRKKKCDDLMREG